MRHFCISAVLFRSVTDLREGPVTELRMATITLGSITFTRKPTPPLLRFERLIAAAKDHSPEEERMNPKSS